MCKSVYKNQTETRERSFSQTHTMGFFLPVLSLFALPVFPVWSITQGDSCMKICACVCHCEWACADGSQGRCKRLGGILVVVGLKASFSSRLWLCVFERICMWNASAARGRQTPSCWVVCIMDAQCVAAAYYHLVRGEDRVVITTSSSASGYVFSLNLHAQVICHLECVSRKREWDKHYTM